MHVPDGFPEEFRRFLQRWVVDAAELAAYLSLMAKVSDADVELYLERFRAAGLIDAAADGHVRYSTQDERACAHVRMLSQAYKERPVTLFRAIYARS